jgi:uncharacterized protein (DUF697 family)
MTNHSSRIIEELNLWKKQMQRHESFSGKLSRKLQHRINKAIPEKIHHAITTAIKQMTRTVLLGAAFTTTKNPIAESLPVRELMVYDRIKFYSNTAAAEGAITGAGGILLGLADFPIWLTLKMKMLFEIASLYGKDITDYKERIYILYIFELTFSSQLHRNKIFEILDHWSSYEKQLPEDVNLFDWRSFQQEYRDYIDVAKLFQLIPGIGAAVGAIVNHRLTTRLGKTAMNAYRLRHFSTEL